MRLNFDMTILELMADGVILLSRQGQVMAHNRAASDWVPQARALSLTLARLIAEEVRGHSFFPSRVDLFSTAQQDAPRQLADAWLCKNGRHAYALFIGQPHGVAVHAGTSAHAQTVPTAARTAEPAMLVLLGDSARRQLQLLRRLLAEPQQASQRQALAAKCVQVERLLGEMVDLSALLQRDLPFNEDRLDMAEVLREVLTGLPAQQGGHAVDYRFVQEGGKCGVVYGSQPWLVYALRVLVSALVDSLASAARVQLVAHQMGNFLMLTGHATALPLHANVAQGNAGGVATPQDVVVRRLMCERILELHGGKLKLTYLDPEAGPSAPGNGLESFALSFPTGVQPGARSADTCASCPYVLQAQAYATDMADLMSHPAH